jgi:uncharacterized caspase-like protein
VAPAHTEKRVALVVGNGAYRHAEVLENPINDARGMRDALKQIGFEVAYGENLDQRAMRQTIGQFARAVRGANVAVVYFAGHGATFADTPYVVPVDAEFTSLEQVPYELIPVEMLIGELRRVNGLRIAILDACRDNAAERELKRLAGGARGGELTRGLAPIKNPEGLILAYATQYLSTAADTSSAGNSPFTSALLHNIATPGLDVKELFFRVGQEVVIATDNRQRPEISISLYESYALVPAPAEVQPMPAVAPVAAPAVAPAATPTVAPAATPAVTPAKPGEAPQRTAVPQPVFVPAAVPTKPAEETPQRTAVPAPVDTPPAAVPAKPATDSPKPHEAAIPAPVHPEEPPLAEPKPTQHERHRTHAARPSERERHERWRPRWESESPRRPPREPRHTESQARPIVNDCIRVTFPQCSRGNSR